jgi:hypothetical protein
MFSCVLTLREGISSTSCDNRISYRYGMQMYCTFVLFVNHHFLGLSTSGTHCINTSVTYAYPFSNTTTRVVISSFYNYACS